MAFYSSSWNYRRSLTLVHHTGGAATIDVTASIPATDDEFWTNVLASGNDVRVTGPDGVTLLTYDLDSFNTTTRVGTIEIDNYSVPALNKISRAWIYFGNSGAADARSAFSPSGPYNGFIELGQPTMRAVEAAPERPGDLLPRIDLTKTTNEEFYVDFDFARMLEGPPRPYQGRMDWEEISYVSAIEVLQNSVDVSSLYTTGNHRIAGKARVRAFIKAGTTANDYTISCRVATVRPGDSNVARILEARARLRVRNTSES